LVFEQGFAMTDQADAIQTSTEAATASKPGGAKRAWASPKVVAQSVRGAGAGYAHAEDNTPYNGDSVS
jgi:hypothetical protein